jgi:hypothetical protein
MRYLRAGLVGLVGLSAACGSSRAPASAAPEPSTNEIAVQVDNQNFNDMDIYVVRSGTRWLLGHAGGLTKTTLTIPSGTVTDGRVRLLAQPIGGNQRISTPTLVVAPGQSVFWTIGSDPAMSNASAGLPGGRA